MPWHASGICDCCDGPEEFEPDATEIGPSTWDYEIEPEHNPRDHNFVRDDEPTLDFGRCVDVD